MSIAVPYSVDADEVDFGAPRVRQYRKQCLSSKSRKAKVALNKVHPWGHFA